MKSKQCPWSGQTCSCSEFPYKRNSLIPQACEDKIIYLAVNGLCGGIPELVPLRAVSPNAKFLYKKYMADVKAGKYKDAKQ